jgi:hypothetical protein
MDLNLLLSVAVVLMLLVVAAAVLTRPRRPGHLAYRVGPDYGNGAARARRGRDYRRGR